MALRCIAVKRPVKVLGEKYTWQGWTEELLYIDTMDIVDDVANADISEIFTVEIAAKHEVWVRAKLDTKEATKNVPE